MTRPRRLAALLLVAALGSGCGRLPVSWVPGLAGGDDDLDPGEIPALEERAAADATNPYWPWRIARIREANGDAPGAETALRDALARDPAHAASLSLLSKVYWDGGRFEDGVNLLEAARDAGTFPPELAAALALHYEALGWLDESEALAETIEDRMDWSKGGSALAFLRLRGDEFGKSKAIAKRALDADASAVNHNNWGIAQLYAGDPEAARKSFLTASDMDPELPGPLYNLAIVDRFYFFDEEAARDWFRRYRELSDEDPDGLAEILAVGASPGPEEGSK